MNTLPKQLQVQQEQIEAYDRSLEASEPQTPPADPPAPPAPTPAPVSPSQPATPPAPAPDDETFRQRFLTLQGKYNAEVPRMHAQLKDMQSKLDAATARIEALTKPAKPAEPPKPLLTDKDAETYGGDLLDFVKRAATQVATEREGELIARIERLQSENEEFRKQISGVAEKQGLTDQELYFRDLRTAVPDFDAVNNDPDFVGWLDTIDNVTGVARQAYLDSAFQKFDVVRTKAIIDAWRATKAPAAPAPAPAPAPSVSPEVQRQVAPGKSKASSTPVSTISADKVWTQSEIKSHYDSLTNGTFRGTAQEASAIEAAIDQALAEGRVR